MLAPAIPFYIASLSPFIPGAFAATSDTSIGVTTLSISPMLPSLSWCSKRSTTECVKTPLHTRVEFEKLLDDTGHLSKRESHAISLANQSARWRRSHALPPCNQDASCAGNTHHLHPRHAGRIYIYTCQDRYCSARVHPRAPRSGLLMECAHCTSLDCMAGRQHREDVVAQVSSHWLAARAMRCVPGSCLYCYLL